MHACVHSCTGKNEGARIQHASQRHENGNRTDYKGRAFASRALLIVANFDVASLNNSPSYKTELERARNLFPYPDESVYELNSRMKECREIFFSLSFIRI